VIAIRLNAAFALAVAAAVESVPLVLA